MVPVGLETDFWNVALAATAEALAPEVTMLLYLLKLFPGLLCDEAGSSCFADPVLCRVVIGLDSALRFLAT